jgi:hypothetical protein
MTAMWSLEEFRYRSDEAARVLFREALTTGGGRLRISSPPENRGAWGDFPPLPAPERS